MSDTRRARPATPHGPTAATVASNIHRLRKAGAMSIYALSERLRAAGRPISPSAIGKTERGERQVSVDELVAFAAALESTPSALLLPLDDHPDTSVEITGVGTVPANVAWDWIDGKRPLVVPDDPACTERYLHAIYSRPPGRRGTLEAKRRR
ncbi:helix-turn-helix domain-containing protein [Streptomyces rubiginosohelvolus]